MKFPILTCIFSLMAAGLGFSQSPEDIKSITFTKQTRGFLDEVVISPDSVQGFTENHREPENARDYSTAVDTDQWARLMLALKDVPLEDLDGLQSPSMNRAHDGALHSTIMITFKDGETISHSFDDENPHPDLQPLLDAILELRMPSSR